VQNAELYQLLGVREITEWMTELNWSGVMW
jgi:hypothetical protein